MQNQSADSATQQTTQTGHSKFNSSAAGRFYPVLYGAEESELELGAAKQA